MVLITIAEFHRRFKNTKLVEKGMLMRMGAGIKRLRAENGLTCGTQSFFAIVLSFHSFLK